MSTHPKNMGSTVYVTGNLWSETLPLLLSTQFSPYWRVVCDQAVGLGPLSQKQLRENSPLNHVTSEVPICISITEKRWVHRHHGAPFSLPEKTAEVALCCSSGQSWRALWPTHVWAVMAALPKTSTLRLPKIWPVKLLFYKSCKCYLTEADKLLKWWLENDFSKCIGSTMSVLDSLLQKDAWWLVCLQIPVHNPHLIHQDSHPSWGRVQLKWWCSQILKKAARKAFWTGDWITEPMTGAGKGPWGDTEHIMSVKSQSHWACLWSPLVL